MRANPQRRHYIVTNSCAYRGSLPVSEDGYIPVSAQAPPRHEVTSRDVVGVTGPPFEHSTQTRSRPFGSAAMGLHLSLRAFANPLGDWHPTWRGVRARASQRRWLAALLARRHAGREQ